MPEQRNLRCECGVQPVRDLDFTGRCCGAVRRDHFERSERSGDLHGMPTHRKHLQRGGVQADLKLVVTGRCRAGDGQQVEVGHGCFGDSPLAGTLPARAEQHVVELVDDVPVGIDQPERRTEVVRDRTEQLPFQQHPRFAARLHQRSRIKRAVDRPTVRTGGQLELPAEIHAILPESGRPRERRAIRCQTIRQDAVVRKGFDALQRARALQEELEQVPWIRLGIEKLSLAFFQRNQMDDALSPHDLRHPSGDIRLVHEHVLQIGLGTAHPVEETQWEVITLVGIVTLRLSLGIAGHDEHTVRLARHVDHARQIARFAAERQVSGLSRRPAHEVIAAGRCGGAAEQDQDHQHQCRPWCTPTTWSHAAQHRPDLLQRERDEDVRHRRQTHHPSVLRHAVGRDDHREDHHRPPQHTEGVRWLIETIHAQRRTHPEQHRQ